MTAPRRELVPPPRYDLAGTVGALGVVPADPTVDVRTAGEAWWATRTPDGPATLRLRLEPACPPAPGGGQAGDCPPAPGGGRFPARLLVATGYGPGAGWLVERADAIAGLRDELGDFPTLAARHPVVRRLARDHCGLRLPATGRLFHHLVPAVLGQKVTRAEATRGYLGIVRSVSQRAPGPHPGLWLPPDAARLAAMSYWEFHGFGVERRRAETLVRAAVYAGKLEAAPDAAEATRRMTVLPGIGAWTAAEVVRPAYGDPDAVSVGDYHLPDTVVHALTGAPRGDDARMLALLEPFSGHRGRVCCLLIRGGIRAPRFGPPTRGRSFMHT